ncbi:hypothetical protein KEM56_001344 [Ascosphaera pollenicola]|nr:hypothetical protein KEM56_001344 [Ascosphaera pollenicola]
MKTSDSIKHPLPDFDILDMQWTIQLVLGASCAGLTSTPDVDGAGTAYGLRVNDLMAADLDQPVDLGYYNRRLGDIAHSRLHPELDLQSCTAGSAQGLINRMGKIVEKSAAQQHQDNERLICGVNGRGRAATIQRYSR